ncbi:MAG TPA: glycosyltransferase family 4 protein [Bosea sp. (in: a-proteobacteria)]|jgi:glycosyltransferase involved in cell wall biosynthesis|uniref:glycosyltransferase family 4 protein n=1 Tax=Bosea sp. (in: a-proteobacteria) TaxID=1871050 RepID=UPI002E150866|nr:glycosyltransferase family 4 protein [Bosea sp. (in: a-proteobacteria)]
MRILVATNFHPVPPVDGMQLHLYAVLAELKQRHDILLISPRPTKSSVDDLELAKLCSDHVEYDLTYEQPLFSRALTELRTFVTGRSRVVDFLLRSSLRDAVLRAVETFKPDVIHLQSGAVAALAPIDGIATVAAPLDADDLNAAARIGAAGSSTARWKARREAARFRRFEAEAYARSDELIVVTQRDADVLRGLNAALRPTIIPNGIDTIKFSPATDGTAGSAIVFHGAMDYEPNVDAVQFLVRDILPIVRQRHPDAQVVLAGRNPNAAVRELSAPNVRVTGALDSVVPVIQQAAVYVCPMRVGSGIKNKLLEAMACGAPIVATPLATAGIGIERGVHALVEDGAGSIASAISDILDDADLRTRLGRAARELAELRSWSRCAEEFERVYAAASGLAR